MLLRSLVVLGLVCLAAAALEPLQPNLMAPAPELQRHPLAPADSSSPPMSFMEAAAHQYNVIRNPQRSTPAVPPRVYRSPNSPPSRREQQRLQQVRGSQYQQQQQQQEQQQQQQQQQAAPLPEAAPVQNALEQYQSFLQRNQRFATNLETLFKQYNIKHTGSLDAEELQALVDSKTLSPAQANMIKSWDVDRKGSVSLKQFMMGPLYLSLLELVPEKKQQYFSLLEQGGDLSEFQTVFSKAANGEAADPTRFAQTHFSFGSIAGSLGSAVTAASQVIPMPSIVKQGLAMAGSAISSAAPPSTQPTSKWGIPSSEDEACVLCQFVVDRIQYELFHTLAGEGDAFPADPNEPIEPSQIRKVNGRIMNKQGGKGMLRIIAEDVIADLCDADTMPELFYQQCERLDASFATLIDAIFYQFHAQAVCSEAQMCTSYSYYSDPTSVHLPLQSKVYNGGRGICGLTGGAHERADRGLTATVCFAAKTI